MNNSHLIRQRSAIGYGLLLLGSAVVIVVLAVGMMIATSWYDVRYGEYGVGNKGRLHFDRIQPSKTRGVWVRYRYESPSGYKFEMYWTIKPFRGVIEGNHY